MKKLYFSPIVACLLIAVLLMVACVVGGASADYQYSFVHLSDVQSLSNSHQEGLNATFDYIENHKTSDNIIGIFNTGDNVQNATSISEWANYTASKTRTTVPFIVELPGNHDDFNYIPWGSHNGSFDLTQWNANIGTPINGTKTFQNFVICWAAYMPDNSTYDSWYSPAIMDTATLNSCRFAINNNITKIPLILTHNYMYSEDSFSDIGYEINSNLMINNSLVLSGHNHMDLVTLSTVNSTSVFREIDTAVFGEYSESQTDYANSSRIRQYFVTASDDNTTVKSITSKWIKTSPPGLFSSSPIVISGGSSGVKSQNASVKLYIPANATPISDQSQYHHTITNTNVTVNWTNPIYGVGSMWISNSTVGYLTLDGSSDFAFGSSDFSIEGSFIVPVKPVGSQIIYDSRPSGTAGGLYPIIRTDGGGNLSYSVNGSYRIQANSPPAPNILHRWKLNRIGGLTTLWYDGSLVGSYIDTNVYLNGASRPIIGNSGNIPTDATTFISQMDDIVVTVGNGTISNQTALQDTEWISNPTAAFTLSATSGTSPLSVTATNISVGNVNVSSTSWYLTNTSGNNTQFLVSTSPNPIFNLGAGNWNINLTTTNPFGKSTASNPVTVYPLPIPTFNGTPTSGNSTLTVSFVDTSASNATFAYWNWSFGDGTFTSSTVQNITHVYSNAGSTPVQFTVALNVTNIYNGFNTTTLTNYITVNPAAPVTNFNAAPVTGTSPLTVSFIDASTTNDTLAAWSWNFGDGDTTNSTLQNPVHTYHLTGPSATAFTISLDVTDQYGTSNTTTKSNYIAVYPAPVSGFTATPVIGLFPLTVHFNLTSPSTDNASYVNWSLGDGTVLNLTAPSTWNISHLYSSGGSYTVSETTANPGGSNTTTMTGMITVTNYTVSGFTCTPILGSFNYTTTCNVTLAQDNATSWIWSFGDTKPNAYTQNVTHTYTQMGNFTITEQAINPYWTNTTPLTNYIVVNWSPVYGTGTWIPSGIPLKIGNTYILNEQWQEAGTTVPVDCDAGGTTFSIVELGIIQPTIYPGNIGLYQAYYTPTDPGIYTWRMNCTVAGHPASDSGKISVLY